MLLIRVDGNEKIGLGHVMRCLSIADEVKKLGDQVIFLLADQTVSEMIMERGFDSYILNTDYRNMESEIPVICMHLNQGNIPNGSCILVDSYQCTENYYKELGKYFRVVAIDDLFSMDYPVDMVINYNIYGDLLREKETNYPNRILLTGVSYAPLRSQFLLARGRKHGVQSGQRHILIMTGGADSLHLAKKITEDLLLKKKQEEAPDSYLQDVIIDVVCGAMNPNISELKDLELQNQECVRLHIDVKDMASLMSEATLAISAAGSTVYELSSLGIPFVVYSFVENQKLVAKYANQVLGVVYAGDFEKKSKEDVMNSILQETIHLLSDVSYRNAVSEKLYEIVDGKGAIRIAEELRKLS